MFFLLRSACCIGVVVAALPEPGQQNRRGEPIPTKLEQLCRAAPARCLDLLSEGLRAGSGEAFAALANRAASQPSRDTLTAADRRPAWAGRSVAMD